MGIAGWAKRGHYRVDCVEGCVFPLGIGLDDLTTRDSKLYKMDRRLRREKDYKFEEARSFGVGHRGKERTLKKRLSLYHVVVKTLYLPANIISASFPSPLFTK
jgi:hypothetical protein